MSPHRTLPDALARRLDHTDDRGAVLPVIALLLVVLLSAGAFAVDLGMQRVLARDVQATADVLALDLARRLDGRPRAQVEAAMEAARDATLARNAEHIGELEDVSFEAGRTNPDGTFRAIAADEVPDAVQVTVAGRVPFAFTAAFGGPASGPATRSAVVSASALPPVCLPGDPTCVPTTGCPAGDPTCTPRDPVPGSACIRLGAIALGLDSGSSPLVDPLLGDALNTSLVGYAALADATIELGALAAELGAGSPQELAGTTVSIGQLYAATADVLTRNGDVAHATLLNSLVVAAESLTIGVGDLLAVRHADESAMDLHLNVLDLVTGAAFIANGTNALNVPAAAVTVPGMTDVTAQLVIVQGPVIACDSGIADSSQVTLRLQGRVPGLPLATGTPTLQVAVDLANARGFISDLDCPSGPPTFLEATVTGRTVARLSVATTVAVQVELPVVGSLLPVPTGLSVGVSAATNPTTGASTALVDTTSFDEGLSAPTRVGGGSLGLAPLTVGTNVTVAGLPVSATIAPLLTPLVGGLNTVLTNVQSAVQGPIADQLGLTVNGVDVWALDAPVCAHPRPVS